MIMCESLKACSEIPDNSFLHTVAVEIGGKTQYTTLVFGKLDILIG